MLTIDSEQIPAENNETVSANQHQPNIYKCVSCDYLFGNLSDMKRHLRQRHRIHLADMRQNMDDAATAAAVSQETMVTEIVPMENQDGITSAVQVKHLMPLISPCSYLSYCSATGIM